MKTSVGKYIRTAEIRKKNAASVAGSAVRGTVRSQATKDKMRAAWTPERRQRRAAEARAHMQARTKHPRGWKLSQEARLKQSLREKGKPHPWQAGKPSKAETRRKISEARKLNNPGFLVQCSRRTSSLERTVSKLLHDLGEPHFKQMQIGQYFCDIFVPRWNLVVECDGKFWHSRFGSAEKDRKRDDFIAAQGARIVHLPEDLIKDSALLAHVVKGCAA